MHLRLVIILLFVTLYVAMHGQRLDFVAAQPVGMSSMECDHILVVIVSFLHFFTFSSKKFSSTFFFAFSYKKDFNYFRQKFETHLHRKEKNLVVFGIKPTRLGHFRPVDDHADDKMDLINCMLSKKFLYA